MRHMVVCWTNDSNDLHLLDDVATMTVGGDGMEVLVSDFSATCIREIVAENPDRLTLDTDDPAAFWTIASAIDWYNMEYPRVRFPDEYADIQDVLRILGTDDRSEVESIIEAELGDADCRAWHEGEGTENLRLLVDLFGAFQVWGVRIPRQGEEPLSIIWPA